LVVVHNAFKTFPDFELDDTIGKFWLVYGSAKTLDAVPYLVTRVFSDRETNAWLEINTFQEWVQRLSLDNSGQPTRRLHAASSSVDTVRSVAALSDDDDDDDDDDQDDDRQRAGRDDKLQLLQGLVDVISPHRSQDYHTWMEIGCIIHSETRSRQRDEEGLQLFLHFSKKSNRYDEVGCVTFWNGLQRADRPRRLCKKMGTLIFLARKDDERATQRVLDEWKASRAKCVPTTEYRIAADFYEWNPDSFMYCSQNKWWYIFEKHYWRKINDEQMYFTPLFVKMSDWYRDRTDSLEDAAEKKAVGALVRKLETSSSQNNIIRQLCTFYFYSEDLPQLMNMNANLIAFKNGVYDTSRHCFREGMPADLLSKTLAIDYVGEPSARDVADLHNYFEMILPDVEVRNYFFRCLCGVFTGGNPEKICLFWTGKGNNGKSKTQLLFEKMFGVLACKLPISVLTSKRGKVGTATPELAMLAGGVRWAVVEEPEETDAIQSGIFKNLTGNDSIYARPIYGQPMEFTPMCKLMVICNELPHIVGGDKATWLRVRVIPFESRFSSHAPASREEQVRLKHFPIDVNVERRFPIMAKTLAHYLLQLYRQKMADEELGVVYPVPDKVNKASLDYQISSNKMLATCQELFDRVETPTVSVEELFNVVNKHWKIYYSHETLNLASFTSHYADVNEKGVYYAFKCGGGGGGGRGGDEIVEYEM
jgi:P4 family phage/plasmid primase-like protien